MLAALEQSPESALQNKKGGNLPFIQDSSEFVYRSVHSDVCDETVFFISNIVEELYASKNTVTEIYYDKTDIFAIQIVMQPLKKIFQGIKVFYDQFDKNYGVLNSRTGQ